MLTETNFIWVQKNAKFDADFELNEIFMQKCYQQENDLDFHSP
jgi:hypothetical protein